MTETYNLKEVALTVNGIPIEGFGETDAITVEYSEEAWTMTVGADGEVTRSRTNNESGTMQITLMATSEANAVLQSALLLDKTIGRTLFNVTITDWSNGEVVFGNDCWVEQSPSKSFDKVVSERVWTIACPRLRESPLSGLGIDAYGF